MHPTHPSTPPPERVNITYRTSHADGAESLELPLRALVLGDFRGESLSRDDALAPVACAATGRASDGEAPALEAPALEAPALEDRQPMSVNQDNFEAVMRQLAPHIEVRVRDALSGLPDASMHVSLRFESMRDFEPEGVVQQVAELRQLLALRQALVALRGPLGNLPSFRRRLRAMLGNPQTRRRLMQELDTLALGPPAAPAAAEVATAVDCDDKPETS